MELAAIAGAFGLVAGLLALLSKAEGAQQRKESIRRFHRASNAQAIANRARLEGRS